MRSRAGAPRPRRSRPGRSHYRPIPVVAAATGPITMLGSITHTYGSPSAATLDGLPAGVVGNARVLIVRNYHATGTVTALSGGGPPSSGTGAWARIAGPTTDADGSSREIWIGRINNTTSTTIAVTYSATPTVLSELVGLQLASTAGTSATWGRVGTQQGLLNTTSSATPLLPSLTATATGQAYVGHICVGGSASPGATSGFTYYTGPNFNLVVVNPHVTAGTVQPAAAQSPASTAQAIAVLITD